MAAPVTAIFTSLFLEEVRSINKNRGSGQVFCYQQLIDAVRTPGRRMKNWPPLLMVGGNP